MPKRVLIVDDSPSLRKLVFILLTSNGFAICGEAENGAEAIEKARETRPDIIVMDYSMPVMDGIRAAKSLKQLMPRVPLLLFTLVHSCSLFMTAVFWKKRRWRRESPRLSQKTKLPISSLRPARSSAPEIG